MSSESVNEIKKLINDYKNSYLVSHSTPLFLAESINDFIVRSEDNNELMAYCNEGLVVLINTCKWSDIELMYKDYIIYGNHTDDFNNSFYEIFMKEWMPNITIHLGPQKGVKFDEWVDKLQNSFKKRKR